MQNHTSALPSSCLILSCHWTFTFTSFFYNQFQLNRSVSEIPKNRAPGNCLPVSSSELFTRRSSTMTTRVATDASNFTNPTSSRPVPAETSSNLPIAVNLSLERIRDLLPPTCTLNDAERIYCKVNDSKRRHLLGLKLFNYFFSMEDQKRGNPSNLSTSKLEIIKSKYMHKFSFCYY